MPHAPDAERHPTTLFVPPEGSWRRRQLLTAETASLLASLTAPRAIDPDRVDAHALAALILDGLLECEIDNGFLSGGAAHRLFFPGARSPAATDTIGRLSADALQLAATFSGASPATLADRLYHYNTRPCSPAWRRRLPDPGAAADYHDLGRLVAMRRHGTTGIHAFTSGPWQAWEATAARATGSGPTWKLYLSPTPDHTAEACRALHATLGRAGGPFSMKVGRTLAGVLRPDRIVAYFASAESLHATAARMRATLATMPAQGVPFTTAIGPDGLLSWGADFPADPQLPPLARERSWRGWIAVRLASALTVALASDAPDPVQCARDRVSLDGVDTATWTPAESLLNAATVEVIDADQ